MAVILGLGDDADSDADVSFLTGGDPTNDDRSCCRLTF
jgi:hypothetical protein